MSVIYGAAIYRFKEYVANLRRELVEVRGTLVCSSSVPIVQRSGRGPFKAETRVRFPVGTPLDVRIPIRGEVRLGC